MILFLSGCNSAERQDIHDYIVFESDTRSKDVSFKPTATQIDKAESKLLSYLEEKTKNKQTIYITSFDKKVPLQEQLKYYKRRYFGRTNNESEKIIKIEFVFVRCGEQQDEWKQINYASDTLKGCWWSVQYNINKDVVFDLKLRDQ